MRLAPFIIWLVAFASIGIARPRPVERELFGRTCYGILVRWGILSDPRKVRAYRVSQMAKINQRAQDYVAQGISAEEAETRAQRELLEELGFDGGLARRWVQSEPTLIRRVLLDPDNAPVTGFHGIRVDPQHFNVKYQGFQRYWRAFYFAFQEDTALSFTATKWPYVGIVEKYQVPSFGWEWEMSQSSLSSSKIPTHWPAISSRYVSDPSLFTTHFKFPAYSDEWFPYDSVIVDGHMVLPDVVREGSTR